MPRTTFYPPFFRLSRFTLLSSTSTFYAAFSRLLGDLALPRFLPLIVLYLAFSRLLRLIALSAAYRALPRFLPLIALYPAFFCFRALRHFLSLTAIHRAYRALPCSLPLTGL